MRSIVRRDTGETYQDFLTRLAKASGIADADPRNWRGSTGGGRRQVEHGLDATRTTPTPRSRR